MSTVPSLEGNHMSSASGQANNSEDGVQKEALKEMIMHLMHHELKPNIESLVHNIVKEKLRNLLTGLDRTSENQVHTSEPRCLKLQFLKNVSLPILTNQEIQGESHTSIEVALIDNFNEKVVDSGPEASANVEIVALEGDVGGAKGDDWTSEEFNRKIVREREGVYTKQKKRRRREGKKPLLDGDVHLRLNKGIGVVGKIKFRQYTRWMKNHEFKLGARVLDSFSGVRIKEAVTKPFIVKDRRITLAKAIEERTLKSQVQFGCFHLEESSTFPELESGTTKEKLLVDERKRGPLSLSDDVSKLKNIRKGGNHHKRLREQNINTVEDFLIQLFRDPEHLEHILGLVANLWEVTVNHARKCAIDKRICYYYSSQQKIGVAFNVIEQVLGLISGCEYFPIEDLSEKDKVEARLLAITAFDHWQHVLHFHDKNSLLQYVDSVPTTEEISNPPKLQISCGDNTSFQGISSSIDSSPQANNVEDFGLSSADNVEVSEELNLSLSGDDLQSPNSSSTDSLMEFVENYFRLQSQQKAQKSWKKLSIVVRISMKKWQL